MKTVTKTVIKLSEIPENLQQNEIFIGHKIHTYAIFHIDDSEEDELTLWLIKKYPTIKMKRSFLIHIDKEIEEQNIFEDENFILSNGFIKTKGRFGEYFYHEKFQLFRCWFYNGYLQIGKKDVEKDICVWIAAIENKTDFLNFLRIATK